MTNREAIKELTMAGMRLKTNGHMDNNREKSFIMAINALEKQDKHRWIPVSERLPKLGETVMCCNCYGSVFASCLTYKRPFKQNTQCHDFGQHYGVIAWMPLPEPYNEIVVE